MGDAPRLVLGPMLRHVGQSTAVVWMETDRPCEVRILDTIARNFTVHGHHYALAEIAGLAPGSVNTYTVTLDGTTVWPEPDSRFPASRISTSAAGRPLRLVFGSCRTAVPHDAKYQRSHGIDVLRALALDLATPDGGSQGRLPDLLLLLGDQVYADEPPEQMCEFIRARRGEGRSADAAAGPAEDATDGPAESALETAPVEEVVDYTEYAQLYRLAWSEPAVRWLLSTVPTAMIFDDHDVRDDWNTSAAWQQQVRSQPWWRRRIVSALGSYWVYQHLGNLGPAERAEDPVYRAVMGAEGDAGPALNALVAHADEAPEAYRWSYSRDLDGSRLLVLDTRASRVVTPGARTMLPPDDWDWFTEQASGDVNHLLIGSSLPYLLPRGLHHLESWNEAVCDGAWGRGPARAAEWIRQAIDLEHWGAFRRSFDAMARLLADVAGGRRGTPPASILLMSGDVHYSYLAKAWFPRQRLDGAAPVLPADQQSQVYQAVCSPIRNPLGRLLRWGNAVASTGLAGAVGRPLAAAARVGRPDIDWQLEGRPRFDNALAVLDLDGRNSTLRLISGPAMSSVTGDDTRVRVLEEVRLA